MGLLDSMTKDLGMTVRVNIDDVRINCLNEAIYDDAENGPLQHLYGCNSHHFGHQHGVSYSADAQLL